MLRASKLSLVGLIITLLLTGLAGPAAAQGSAGAISGSFYFDQNGNGLRDAGEEGGIGEAVIELRDAENVLVTSAMTAELDGSYHFGDLAAGKYTVMMAKLPPHIPGDPESGPAPYTMTTVDSQAVTVTDAPAIGVNFGATMPMVVNGYVFNDADVNGIKSTTETGMANASVQVYRDSDGDGSFDLRVGFDLTDSQGFYSIGDLMPGLVVVVTTLSGGINGGSVEQPLLSSQAGAITIYRDLPVPPYAQHAWATLFGTIWNDLDGDEIIDAGDASEAAEPVFPPVTCYLYADANQNGVVDVGEVSTKVQTDTLGQYKLLGIVPGSYIFQVNEGALPGAYTLSTNADQMRFTLKAGEIARLDVGYYDPLAVAPLRVADWKKEIRQTGHPFFTATDLGFYAGKAEEASHVFPEVTWGESILDVIINPSVGQQGQARKEHAALQMNIAVGRLLLKTPVNLPQLTTATTVAAVVTEIEGLLAPAYRQMDSEYERARKLAEALNKGKGIGYGLDGGGQIARATYKGADVTNKLKTVKDEVDLVLGQPIYLLRWNTGSIDPNNVVINPQVRIRVKRFDNGGIVEVMQVLTDGTEISLGTAVPTVWNRDVNAAFTFYLWNAPTVATLQNLELRVYLRDPADDGGSAEHARVDSAELVFRY